MENREKVVQRLRGFWEQRRQVQAMEKAMQVLTPAERLTLDRMVVRPRKGAGQELCQLLEVEIATVYRYRNSALRKLAAALDGEEA